MIKRTQRLGALPGVAIIALLAIGLTGCSSGSGGTSPTDNPFAFNTVEEAMDQLDLLNASVDQLGQATSIGQLPSGSVNYFGITVVSDQAALDSATLDPDALAFIGQMQVTAQFDGNGSVSGVADNFIDRNDNAVSGSLRLFSAGGIVDDNAGGVTTAGRLNGSLVNASGDNFTFDRMPVNSTFGGTSAQIIAGAGFDSVSVVDGITTDETAIPDVGFSYIAERQ